MGLRTARGSSAIIRAMRAFAGGCAVIGVLLVSTGVAISDGLPHEIAALAVMGGILAITPYVLTRAIEEVINERPSQ
jgi:hypothetical protein